MDLLFCASNMEPCACFKQKKETVLRFSFVNVMKKKKKRFDVEWDVCAIKYIQPQTNGVVKIAAKWMEKNYTTLCKQNEGKTQKDEKCIHSNNI